MNPQIRDLAYFITVAELAHLGRAAEALHISPSALSKCIDRLESAYAAELFERVGRGIRLTEAGQVLLDRARQVEQWLDQTQRHTAALGKGLGGTIRVGAAASCAAHLLPAACRALREQAPDVRVELQVGMNDVLREQLRKGVLDIVVGPAGPADDELRERPVAGDDVVVAAALDHPLIGREVEIQALTGESWLLSPPSVATRQWLDAAFERHGLAPPNVAIVSNSIVAAPQLISETGLLSFISRQSLARFGLGEVKVRGDLLTLRRRFAVLHRVDAYLSPATVRLMQLLHERFLAGNDG